MKKWGKMIGILGLSVVFCVPANAQEEENIYVNDTAVRNFFWSGAVQNRNDKYEYQVGKLDEQLEAEEITQEEHDAQVEKLDNSLNNELNILDKFQIFTSEDALRVTEVDPDWTTEFPNLHGLEYAKNLETIWGEISNPIVDLRPIKQLDSLKEINTKIAGQTNLNDFKELKKLEKISIRSRGFDSRRDEEQVHEQTDGNPMFTQDLLVDISVLSDLPKLIKATVSVKGVMPPVTLKKGTTSYQLYDPIIPSTQFDGSEMYYYSYLENSENDYDFESDEWLKWEGLTGEEKFLSFEWYITKGNFSYDGFGQIPIRWK